MKNLILGAFLVLCGVLNAQESIEQQVADSACACFSELDSAQISSATSALKSRCLQEAIQKNQVNITKNFETEQRKDDQLQKEGIQGSLLIKVQNILTQSCPNYQLFEKRMQEGRGNTIKRR